MNERRRGFNRIKYCRCGCGMRIQHRREFINGHRSRVYKPKNLTERTSIGIRLGIQRRKKLKEWGNNANY